MPLIPSRFVDEGEVTKAVEKVLPSLTPDVVRIRHNFGEDWTGDAAVFFRIVLSDEASRKRPLRGVTEPVKTVLLNAVRPENLGLQAYFNFRSASEQAEVEEEAWA